MNNEEQGKGFNLVINGYEDKLRRFYGMGQHDGKDECEHNMVDSPEHYNKGKYEVIDVIEDWEMDSFNLGNAIKYIARCESKGDKKNDISKAIWYLRRELTSGKDM